MSKDHSRLEIYQGHRRKEKFHSTSLTYSIKANIIGQFLYNAVAGCRTIRESVDTVISRTPPYVDKKFLNEVESVTIILKNGRIYTMRGER